jgi:hypothetical protein
MSVASTPARLGLAGGVGLALLQHEVTEMSAISAAVHTPLCSCPRAGIDAMPAPGGAMCSRPQ